MVVVCKLKHRTILNDRLIKMANGYLNELILIYNIFVVRIIDF